MFVTKEDEAASIDPQTLENQRRWAEVNRVVSKVMPKPLDDPKPIGERFGEVLDWMLTKQDQPKTLLDLGDKLTQAVTEVGRRDGEPVFFDPTMMHAMGSLKNVGRTSEAIEKLGQKDKLGFTSKLETVVRDKMGGRATTDEIKAMLQSAGVKTEELEDRGFFQWLDRQREKLLSEQQPETGSLEAKEPKISKEAVAQELTGPNRPTLKATELGGANEVERMKKVQLLQQKVDQLKEDQNRIRAQLIEKSIQHKPVTQDAEAGFDLAASRDHSLNVHRLFDQIIYAPDNAASKAHEKLTELTGLSKKQLDDLVEEHKVLEMLINEKASGLNMSRAIGRLSDPKFKQYSLGPSYGVGENYREKLFSEDSVNLKQGQWPTHFSDRTGGQKPLFWLRMQDLTDDQGRKLLNMDELQSDIHQEGRSQGYRKREIPDAEWAKVWELVKSSPDFDHIAAFTKLGANHTRETMLLEASKYLDDETYKKIYPLIKDSGTMTDAPMKKNWVRAGVKNLIQTAIEEGKDGISWTPGNLHNKRYGIIGNDEKGVAQALMYREDQILTVIGKNGRTIRQITVPQQELSSYVGPEIAKQLKAERLKLKLERLERENKVKSSLDTLARDFFKRYYPTIDPSDSSAIFENVKGSIEDGLRRDSKTEELVKFEQRLLESGVPYETIKDYRNALVSRDLYSSHALPAMYEGKDIKLGTHGNETYYDQMVKNEVSEIAKKYGLKIDRTKVTIRNGEQIELWHLPITDKMREDIKQKGQPLYAIPAAVGLGELMREYKQQHEREREQ